MLKLMSPLVFVVGLLASAPVQAYNCAIPAIADKTKRTVCRELNLRDLDASEQRSFASIGPIVGVEGRGQVLAARKLFFSTRGQCGADDTRCLNAVYRSQIRLYLRLRTCSTEKSRDTCVRTTIERHREDLHRSL